MKNSVLAAIALTLASSYVVAEPTLSEAKKFMTAQEYGDYRYCLYTSAYSYVAMESLNKGESREYIYQLIAKKTAKEDERTKDTANKIVSFAADLVSHSGEIIPPYEFASFNYERCIGEMLPHLKGRLAL